MIKIYTVQDAQKLIAGRDIYLWGAGQKGRGVGWYPDDWRKSE